MLKTKSAIGQLQRQDGIAIDNNHCRKRLTYLTATLPVFFKKKMSEPIPTLNDRNITQEVTTVKITSDKISKAIDRLKTSKSQRPNNIHPMLLKECKDALLIPLKCIFEKSHAEHKIPEIWKSAHVSAIFKAGSKSKPENYRPISLTSVSGNLLERIIRDKIVKHMTNNNLFDKLQHGFLARNLASPNYWNSLRISPPL